MTSTVGWMGLARSITDLPNTATCGGVIICAERRCIPKTAVFYVVVLAGGVCVCVCVSL